MVYKLYFFLLENVLNLQIVAFSGGPESFVLNSNSGRYVFFCLYLI